MTLEGGPPTAPPTYRAAELRPPRERWLAVRRVILVIEAIGALIFAAGAIKYERYAYVVAAWGFGTLPLVYALIGAMRHPDSRFARIGALIVLLPSLGLSTLVVTRSCSNRLSAGSNLSGCDFSDASFASIDLHGANLSRATLARADLSHANLRGAKLNDADLTGANLTGSFLNGATLAGADLRRAALGGAALTDVNLSSTDLRGLDLSGRNLAHLALTGADLRGTDLAGSNLAQANLQGANLAGAKLGGARLEGARLSGATVDGADLQDAVLEHASLDRASLKSANLSGATLSGANLEGASLEGAHLPNATLDGARLDGATLEAADLSKADLSGTSLQGVVLRDATLDGASLVSATGLPDTELAQGLGVSEASLGETLTSRRIRLEERSAILETLGAACRGKGVSAAHPYGGSGFRPLVLVDGRGGESPIGKKASALDWEPMAVRFGQLVACVDEEERITVELCPYFDPATGAPGPPTRRVRFRRHVRLLEASTANVLLDQTYEGSFPSACPFSKTSFSSFGEDVIAGSHIGFARFKAKLESYVG